MFNGADGRRYHNLHIQANGQSPVSSSKLIALNTVAGPVLESTHEELTVEVRERFIPQFVVPGGRPRSPHCADRFFSVQVVSSHFLTFSALKFGSC
jgi:hypothetical protein